PSQGQFRDDRDARATVVRRERRLDRRLRAPTVPRLARLDGEDDAAGLLVHLLARYEAGELERDRPQLHLQIRLPGAVAERLLELRARHAGDDDRDVVEQAPGAV